MTIEVTLTVTIPNLSKQEADALADSLEAEILSCIANGHIDVPSDPENCPDIDPYMTSTHVVDLNGDDEWKAKVQKVLKASEKDDDIQSYVDDVIDGLFSLEATDDNNGGIKHQLDHIRKTQGFKSAVTMIDEQILIGYDDEDE